MANAQTNKIEAAQRQIDAAIRMIFAKEDPLAIHTIAAASLQILKDLSKHRGGNLVTNSLAIIIKPGKEREVWAAMNAPSNFLKHADKDPDGALNTLDENVNDLFLLMAMCMYSELEHKWTVEMRVFFAWCIAHHPDCFHLESEAGAMMNDIAQMFSDYDDKAEGLEFANLVLSDLRAKEL